MRSEVGRAGKVGCAGLSKEFGFHSECSGKPREGFTEGLTAIDLCVLKTSPAARWGTDRRRAHRGAGQQLLGKR